MVRVHLSLNLLDYDYRPEQLRLDWQLTDRDGRPVDWHGAAQQVVALDEERPLELENHHFRDELSELQVRIYVAVPDTNDAGSPAVP